MIIGADRKSSRLGWWRWLTSVYARIISFDQDLLVFLFLKKTKTNGFVSFFLGSIGHRFYPNRYSRYPNRVYPQYPVRTDGYDTDSGLISSGRLRMSRPSPSVSSRMAVIPETYMVNNRMFSSSNFQPTMNHSHRRHESYSAGYDTDSTTNHHSARDFYPQQVPIQREEWTDDEFIRPRLPAEPFYQNTSIPLVPEQEDQVKKKNLIFLLVFLFFIADEAKKKNSIDLIDSNVSL